MDSEDADRPGTLTDRIAEALRAQIVTGQRDPADRLPPEAELAAQFDASLPTVRAALRGLISEGLVYARRGPHGGHFVGRPSLHGANRLVAGMVGWLVRSNVISLTDILEARQMLGRTCARLAAQRRGDGDLAAMDLALRKMSDASLSNQTFCTSEIQFARALAAASGNRLLILLHLITTGAYASGARLKVFSFRERETLVDLGSHIVPAIRSRQAEAAMRLHDEMADCLRRFHFPVDGPAPAPAPAGTAAAP